MATTAGGTAAHHTRTALVTGGTGGMGRVIAAQLAADGFDVAVAYAGDVDLADKTVGEISGHGRRGAAFAADIADEGAVAGLFDADRRALRPPRRGRAHRRDQSSSRAYRP